MPGVLHNATLARVPAHEITRLGPLRGAPGITVRLDADMAWVRWQGADAAVVAALLPAPGAAFFVRRDQSWLPCGRRIPVAVPEGEYLPLQNLLLPQPASTVGVQSITIAPVRFSLARSTLARPCSAVVCTPAAVAAWASMAPDSAVARLSACRSGNLAILFGDNPPLVAGGERYWGERVLLPLGWRAERDLPESSLCEAAGCGPEELLLWREGAVFVPRKAIAPLTRAAARLGARDGS